MPFPVAAAVAAGGAILGQGVNALATSKMNKKTREWNERMYAMQRQHNLQDWAMQNEYNSPAAQMQRLMEAGLNPKLVYGDGGATMQAGNIGQADVKTWNPDVPQIDIASAIAQFQDYQVKQVQTDNLRKSGDLMVLDGILKTKESISRDLANATSAFDLKQKERLADVNADLAQRQLEKLTAETNRTLQEIDIAAVMKEPNLQKALQEIASQKASQAKTEQETRNAQETLKNIQQDTRLKAADAKLREKGIYPGDPLWLRAFIQNVEKYFGGDGKVTKFLKEEMPKVPVGRDKLDSTGRPLIKPHPSKTWNKR